MQSEGLFCFSPHPCSEEAGGAQEVEPLIFFLPHESYLGWIPDVTLGKWGLWLQRWDVLRHSVETLPTCRMERLRITLLGSLRFLICLLVISLLAPILMLASSSYPN